jgi:hypothetical protein
MIGQALESNGIVAGVESDLCVCQNRALGVRDTHVDLCSIGVALRENSIRKNTEEQKKREGFEWAVLKIQTVRSVAVSCRFHW